MVFFSSGAYMPNEKRLNTDFLQHENQQEYYPRCDNTIIQKFKITGISEGAMRPHTSALPIWQQRLVGGNSIQWLDPETASCIAQFQYYL